jgi:hypothetical protein
LALGASSVASKVLEPVVATATGATERALHTR